MFVIKIENVDIYGWEAAIRGARNPMNSWDKSDSHYGCEDVECHECDVITSCNRGYYHKHYQVGENDHRLLTNLANAGPDHGKFLRMITVSLDITAPLYWWKEFDTYKVGTVANSCSTMHKIHAKEFTLEDFSHEHLIDDINECWSADIEAGPECISTPLNILEYTVFAMNKYREKFLETKDKKYWWQLIQLLPSSYNQRRTVLLNYQVLKTMYHARLHHKLDEWRDFCYWIRTLPYSELITNE